MIKFFRKIRQSLLAEGKFAQYLKYAIGEIVLVVIGILIAIQLNGLQNKNLQDERTIVYLKQLLEEVEYNSLRSNYLLDSDSLKNGNGITVVQQNERLKLLASLIAGRIDTTQLGILYFLSSTHYNHPRFQRTVYDNGISTGALFKIKNPDLIEHIQLYYTQLTDDERWISDSKATFRDEKANARDFRTFQMYFDRVRPDKLTYTDTFEEEKTYWLTTQLDSILPKSQIITIAQKNSWIFDSNSKGNQDLALYTVANWNYCYSLEGAFTRTIMSSDSLLRALSHEFDLQNE